MCVCSVHYLKCIEQFQPYLQSRTKHCGGNAVPSTPSGGGEGVPFKNNAKPTYISV